MRTFVVPACVRVNCGSEEFATLTEYLMGNIRNTKSVEQYNLVSSEPGALIVIEIGSLAGGVPVLLLPPFGYDAETPNVGLKVSWTLLPELEPLAVRRAVV
jgi:hypothetical protein